MQQRVDAAKALAGAGADAAEALGYAIETDPIIDVREAATESLRKMGPGARKALPALNRYIRSIPLADPTGGAEVMKLELRESDMRGVIRGIINKLK